MITLKVGGHELELTHLDKIYFPPAITKGMLLDYYHRVSDIALPHIHNRLLTLQRFPDGITGTSFYQKDIPDYFPDWIKTKKVAKQTTSGSTRYIICQQEATLLYIANQACITPHRWLSKTTQLNYPDLLIFDLDPPSHTSFDFGAIKKTAADLRTLLHELGLEPFLMTTGSRGLHVVCPLRPLHTFDVVRTVARDIAQYLVHRNPAELTLLSHKNQRKNRILIDIMRNSFGATAVAPYAVRALPGAPVATPLTWDELAHLKTSQAYTIQTLGTRMAHQQDPWHDINRYARSLDNMSQIRAKAHQ